MRQNQTPIRLTAHRFARAVSIFIRSDMGGQARVLFAGVFLLFCGISALNIVNSYVGRNFMTAIAEKQAGEFFRQAIFYTGAFAASTVVSVIAHFVEQRLALLWREFLTRRAVGLYMNGGTFYRLSVSGRLSHPDQRIADDINAFTTTTLSFLLMLLSSALTILTFSGVLWSISPLLFVAAVIYAACGSYMTIVLGRPLIGLNHDQRDMEAAFRASLIRVRENAEPIMLGRGEASHADLLMNRLDILAGNFRRIIAINRNVGFFTTGYNWMIQIVPVVIIAPAFFRGDLEFGVITQSGAAFAMLVGAFSFVVRQFNSISNFAAVVARLSSLLEAIEEARDSEKTAIQLIEAEAPLTYEHLTLLSSVGKTPILKDLSLAIPRGARVLIAGDSEAAGMELFRATAGVSVQGSGRIIRPPLPDIHFLPQRPHFPPGTLRQTLAAEERAAATDDRIRQVLDALDLKDLTARTGGFDKEQDWAVLLSPREHLLLALAKALLAAPQYVFIEKGDAALSGRQFAEALRLLSSASIGCVNFGEDERSGDLYQTVLTYDQTGAWTWTDHGGPSTIRH